MRSFITLIGSSHCERRNDGLNEVTSLHGGFLPDFGADGRAGAIVTVVTGLDVQPFDEVEHSLSQFGDRYLRRIYSEREVVECESNRATMTSGLAIRFAAKEAVLKALAPNDHIPPWRAIEVLYRSKAVPTVELHGEAVLLARQRGVETMHLSVSVGRTFAVAAVVGEVTLMGVPAHESVGCTLVKRQSC